MFSEYPLLFSDRSGIFARRIDMNGTMPHGIPFQFWTTRR
jgi:hypothetical protein